jgi:hypothetical protein
MKGFRVLAVWRLNQPTLSTSGQAGTPNRLEMPFNIAKVNCPFDNTIQLHFPKGDAACGNQLTFCRAPLEPCDTFVPWPLKCAM